MGQRPAMVEHEALAAAVFAELRFVLEDRAADIEQFVRSQGSFEQWTRAEWAARCWRHQAWTTTIESSYRSGAAMVRADLRVHAGRETLLAELAVVHDGTYRKWFACDGKLARDRQRLQETQEVAARLQVIVIATQRPIRQTAAWRDRMAQSTCWMHQPVREAQVALNGSGEVVAYGWLIGSGESAGMDFAAPTTT